MPIADAALTAAAEALKLANTLVNQKIAHAADPILQDADRCAVAQADIAGDLSRSGAALRTSADGVADLDELDRVQRLHQAGGSVEPGRSAAAPAAGPIGGGH